MTDTIRETFTLNILEWKPWLEKAIDTDISEEQRQRIVDAVGTAPNSDYIQVLANDFPAWKTRNVVHRHVFTDDSAAATARRELAATTASRINGCVFCASVHARMYAASAKRRDLAQQFLDEGLAADLPQTERAVVDLAARVTREPESLAGGDLEHLRHLGFNDLDILDAINYAAFFANANRLMLSLGGPVAQHEWTEQP
jgi:uncharacterized peroxidase-related enzyme